jgi:hypothetical protein
VLPERLMDTVLKGLAEQREISGLKCFEQQSHALQIEDRVFARDRCWQGLSGGGGGQR